MILGGVLSKIFAGPRPTEQDKIAPAAWRSRFGDKPGKRFLFTFIGGVLVLIGARLAGGCTSGHMMSGMMQTAVSGYLFAMGTFLAAIPMAILIYGRE